MDLMSIFDIKTPTFELVLFLRGFSERRRGLRFQREHVIVSLKSEYCTCTWYKFRKQGISLTLLSRVREKIQLLLRGISFSRPNVCYYGIAEVRQIEVNLGKLQLNGKQSLIKGRSTCMGNKRLLLENFKNICQWNPPQVCFEDTSDIFSILPFLSVKFFFGKENH